MADMLATERTLSRDITPVVERAVPGIEVLAADRHGHASAWVKSFGGPPGTGFVRLWGRPRLPDPAMVRAVAEHGLP